MLSAMTSDEIRERYLAFFEERGHKRIPSASLVPSAHDPSALLTVAGMHPLKPYFLGQETPPDTRLTDCQKVFRTVDIDNVGNTARHLTFFEMLGNFSFGDYFKHEAIEFAWQLSREVFSFPAESIWVTVFEGDEGLGLGPDEEAISRASGSCNVPARRTSGRPVRAVLAGRALSCTSIAGSSSAPPATCPAARTSASWSTGTSCSCSTTSRAKGSNRCRPTTSTRAWA